MKCVKMAVISGGGNKILFMINSLTVKEPKVLEQLTEVEYTTVRGAAENCASIRHYYQEEEGP